MNTRERVIYVGARQHIYLTFAFGYYPFRWHAYLPAHYKASDLVYISIGEKHGNLKLIINSRTQSFKVMNGIDQIWFSYDQQATINFLIKNQPIS